MPIHVAITRKVKPGKEAEFKEALRKFLGSSFSHEGVNGALMITALPGADSQEIGILRTFVNEAERDAFYTSPDFKAWEAYASTLTDEPVYRQLNGLEAWFRTPNSPPRWKMAIATLCGVYPTSLLLNVVLGPIIHKLPLFIRVLIIAAAMVALLTWVVMPFVIKHIKKWLHASE